jgi:predicted MPP superfamily phosphohydrolase
VPFIWARHSSVVDLRHRHRAAQNTTSQGGLSNLVHGVSIGRRSVGAALVLIGMPTLAAFVYAALREREQDEACLVLVHEPEQAFAAQCAGADLVLAGHTHGGQLPYAVFRWRDPRADVP